jgi:hypothetical protein
MLGGSVITRRFEGLVLVGLMVGCAQDEPLPAAYVRPPAQVQESDATRALREELRLADARHKTGIECGTQYLFEMADIAARAKGQMGGLLSVIELGSGRHEAVTVLTLLGPAAADAIPRLVELAGRSDTDLAEAALRAIDGITYPREDCNASAARPKGVASERARCLTSA